MERGENKTCEVVLADSPAQRKKIPLRDLFHGAIGTIRTSDLFLRREALYPAELRPHIWPLADSLRPTAGYLIYLAVGR